MLKRIIFVALCTIGIPMVSCTGDSTDDEGAANTDTTQEPDTNTSADAALDTLFSDISDTPELDFGEDNNGTSDIEDMSSATDSDTSSVIDIAQDIASNELDTVSTADTPKPITDGIDQGNDTENTDDMATATDLLTPSDTSDTATPSGPSPIGCVTSIAAGHQSFWCQDRLFDIHVPAFCLESPCGLILDVHGLTMSAAMQEKNTQLRKLGEQYGYVVIQPNAQPDPPLASWIPGEDDVRIETFLSDAIAAYAINPAKIHMTGFSQGGFMTWRFLCKHADLFASVAPAAACTGGGADACGFVGNQTPAVRIPILYMHGTDDVLVPFDCAKNQRDAIINAWKLDQSATLSQDENHIRTRYTNVSGDLFEFLQHDYTNDSPVLKSHCFPGSTDSSPTEAGQLLSYGCNPPNAFVWGVEVITFFMAHPKQTAAQ